MMVEVPYWIGLAVIEYSIIHEWRTNGLDLERSNRWFLWGLYLILVSLWNK